MNYKNIFLIIIITLIAATLFVSVQKPKMHKAAFIYNSDYTIVNDAPEIKEEKNIPTITTVEYTKSSQQKLQENIKNEVIQKPVTKKTVETKQVKNKTDKVAILNEQPKPETVKKEVKKETPKQTAVQTETKQVMPKQQTENKVVQKTVEVQKPEPKTVTTITHEQEEVLWNVWRSNLQNQIMKDTSLPVVPNGTIFRFSFDVDKYGKISNIQTYSDTKQYTPYAIQHIAPVIRSYQGKHILNFPNGTNRLTTTVKGAWKISSNTKYSTPKDYNDTEIINK